MHLFRRQFTNDDVNIIKEKYYSTYKGIFAVDNVIQKPLDCLRAIGKYVQGNTDPWLNLCGALYPPFNYDMRADLPDNANINDVWPESWDNWINEIMELKKGKYYPDDIPWEPYTPEEIIAYKFAYHVYDYYNQHPIVQSKLRFDGLGAGPLPGDPSRSVEAVPMFFIRFQPHDDFIRRLAQPCLPVLTSWQESMRAQGHPQYCSHTWALRAVYLGHPSLYAHDAGLLARIEEAVPHSEVDSVLEEGARTEWLLTNEKYIKLKLKEKLILNKGAPHYEIPDDDEEEDEEPKPKLKTQQAPAPKVDSLF